MQFGQHVSSHYARARAEFEDLPAAHRLQHLDALVREASTEQRRYFRRGDEVAFSAELGCHGAVVTEARLIQRQLHETLEADPTTGRLDDIANPLRQALAVRRLFRRQLRQWHGHAQRRHLAESSREITSSGFAATIRSFTIDAWKLPTLLQDARC